jgi:hypothetical protein
MIKNEYATNCVQYHRSTNSSKHEEGRLCCAHLEDNHRFIKQSRPSEPALVLFGFFASQQEGDMAKAKKRKRNECNGKQHRGHLCAQAKRRAFKAAQAAAARKLSKK